MVTPEIYEFGKMNTNPREVKGKMVLPILRRLERAANGTWFVLMEMNVMFELRDGRTIESKKTVRLRCTQEGKRPHPDPFGWKKRKVKKRKRD